MNSVEKIIATLKENARPDQLSGMARYGMTSQGRLGIKIPVLRKMGKEIGKDHGLALKLWKTEITEARILAALVGEPDKLTEDEMDDWVKGFNSWDLCDQVCMNLFDKSPLAIKKIRDWSEREEEYVKRAAFSLLACLAWHDKLAPDDTFIGLFDVIKTGAADDRNYVKKAVSWALRHIGKKNLNLNGAALELAEEIKEYDSKGARWVASDVLRELRSEKVRNRLLANSGKQKKRVI